ncbi:MAG TPA: anti-sigma factor antagonist [Clostridiales bacterium]|nr:anti-sigma factor antagonist [Clostridiales bacterium]
MSVRIEVCGEVVTAYLQGELDHHTAREMREEIDAAIDRNMPTLLVLDFKDITFMDSSGIGLVMGRYRKLQQIKAELHITNTSPHIYKVMKLAGLERLAKIDKGVKANERAK